MGGSWSQAPPIDSALVCGCGYVARDRSDFVRHNKTVPHSHHGRQRKPGDKRFSVQRNEQTREIELTIRATHQATGETVYVPYISDPDPPTRQDLPELNDQPDEHQRLQDWLLSQIAAAAAELGPIEEETAAALAELLSDLLEQGERFCPSCLAAPEAVELISYCCTAPKSGVDTRMTSRDPTCALSCVPARYV